MKIRCVLIDDEAPARDELRYLLSAFDDIEVVAEADSAGSGETLIRRLSPDLVFLDIQMPGRDGFSVISELEHSGTAFPMFVFVTAYDQYAVKAFEASAVDYLMKPVSTDRLHKTIERVKKVLAETDRESDGFQDTLQQLMSVIGAPARTIVKVSVERNGRITLLSPEEIVYCASDSGRILIHTRDDSFPLYGIATIDKLAAHLPESVFFRINRAILVNLNRIREFSPWFSGKYHVIMNDSTGTELTISRARVKNFRQRLGL